MIRLDTHRCTTVSKFLDVVFDLSCDQRVSISSCQVKMCTDSSSGLTLTHQHCISGHVPLNSVHLLSCAQITIVNHERVVNAPSRQMLFSFFLILPCSSAMRTGSPCYSYAMYAPAAVLPAHWEAWVEVVLKLSLLVRRLLLFLDSRPVCSGLPLRAPLFCFSSPASATEPALDMSTSATFSSTSLRHTSGTTFRSWFSIGLTSVIDAVPAGENADEYFDHC